jgi:hypothetical protein
VKKNANLSILKKVKYRNHNPNESWEEMQERLDDPFLMYGSMMGKSMVVMHIPRCGAAAMYRAKLGRVPRSLEGKLSPDKGAAYDRNVELLRKASEGTTIGR